jgi:LmbE family N-acetylglucosaminyl deacetylase
MITATRGEAGKVDPPICRQEDLGIVREAETLKFGYFLGLKRQVIWRYPDGKVADVPLAEISERIARAIREMKPELVLTFEPATGFTMHPDHKAIGHATTEAFRIASDPAFDQSVSEPFAPRFLVYFLAPTRAMRLFGGERGREVAEHQMPAQYEMPIDPEVEIRGWEINESQAYYLRRQWGLPPGILYRLYDREDFAVAKDAGGAPR